MIKYDELYKKRNLVASNLKECIKNKGYTKVSFAGKVGISRPLLDKLLTGEIGSKSIFNKQLKKILKILNMSVDDFMSFCSSVEKNEIAVFSENVSVKYDINEIASKQYDLLLDLIDLCTIYY